MGHHNNKFGFLNQVSLLAMALKNILHKYVCNNQQGFLSKGNTETKIHLLNNLVKAFEINISYLFLTFFSTLGLENPLLIATHTAQSTS